jgi:predicted nuclease of restriction endonuclease-like (RecB) superfamily
MKSKRSAAALLPAAYAPWLAALKDRVRSAHLQAAARVNQELLRLYWEIGAALVEAQQNEGWGQAVIPRLARDLRTEFPEMQGFSERNLGYMVRFAREYGSPPILQQPAAKLENARKGTQPVAQISGEPASSIVPQPAAQLLPPDAASLNLPPPVAKLCWPDPTSAISQQLAAKLPWFHHVILLEKVKDRAARAWYMQATVAHGWSRAVLTAQIAQRAHARAGQAVTNFAATLPPPQSDLAQQTLRDPYLFDFLTLGPAARERDLEQGLADHIQQFLVSLGTGFAFVGRQVHLEVGGQDYYLDLLFYHLRLRCFVVVDLKMEAFQPEFAGKMNFYLSAVDDQLRHRDDQPSLGLLLCQEKNRLTVEYALRDLKKPIGVAEWRTRLVDSLPKKLQGSLPSVAEIERELGGRQE